MAGMAVACAAASAASAAPTNVRITQEGLAFPVSWDGAAGYAASV